ncbi:MAG: DUF2520 domain-containing protein [Porphyromonadaceae bacterium]|nr:DUF2520 domain-containing protein [Porphyromonadaceae bacterium]
MVTTAEKRHIVFIGAGNLATRLAVAWQQAGHDIRQVYSRTEASAQALASRLGCAATTRTEELCRDADTYLFAVSDKALEPLIDEVPAGDTALYLHTAGSMPMELLHKRFRQYGVCYPLQTLSKERTLSFDDIPLFIEGSSPEVTTDIRLLAQSISRQVMEATSEQRRYLHLAAVFACNFPNHLYAIAAEVMKKADLPFNLLLPLIGETAAKIKALAPIDAQTGPAVRFDDNVMQKQIALLDDPDEKEIYRLLSRHIHLFATTRQQHHHE